MSSPDKTSLQTGPLEIRNSVKTALYALRCFAELSLAEMTPPQTLRPASLEISLVRDVESALDCTLPDEVLACLANNDGFLDEYGFDLGMIVDNTELARSQGLDHDSIAVGAHPDGHAYYCVRRQGQRKRSVFLSEVSNFGGGSAGYDLAEWLAEHVERQQEFAEEDYPDFTGPDPTLQANFAPSLVDE